MVEEPVEVITPETMGLAFNAPPAQGKKVLDMSSATGVHGILAAMRGADSVTFMNWNQRSLRFAQFNAWLNGVSDRVHLIQGQEKLRSLRFDLLLANPKYQPNMADDGEESLREALQLASTFLTQQGSFAFVGELANARNLPNHLCQDGIIEGFSGTVVYRNPATSAVDYAVSTAVNKGVADPKAYAQRMLDRYNQLGVQDISDSVLFGWRNTNADHGCGEWDYVGLADTWDSRIDKPMEQRPCYYSHNTRDSCPHIF
jgi:predicted RNA methylase